MSEVQEPHEPLEHLKEGEALTVADLPPDFGNPGVADFADPAWDDTTDEEGEAPDQGEPQDTDDDDEAIEPEDPDEDAPVVPPGIATEDDDDPVEPDDYDPEE